MAHRLLELILNTTIKEITYPEREKTIEARTNFADIQKATDLPVQRLEELVADNPKI